MYLVSTDRVLYTTEVCENYCSKKFKYSPIFQIKYKINCDYVINTEMFSDHVVNKTGHRLELSKVSSQIEGCVAKMIDAKSAGFSGFFLFLLLVM